MPYLVKSKGLTSNPNNRTLGTTVTKDMATTSSSVSYAGYTFPSGVSYFSDWGGDCFDSFGLFTLERVSDGTKVAIPFTNKNTADGVLYAEDFTAFGNTYTVKYGYPVQGIFKVQVELKSGTPIDVRLVIGGNWGSDGNEGYNPYGNSFVGNLSGTTYNLSYLRHFDTNYVDPAVFMYFIPYDADLINSESYSYTYNSDNMYAYRRFKTGINFYMSKANDVIQWVKDDLEEVSDAVVLADTVGMLDSINMAINGLPIVIKRLDFESGVSDSFFSASGSWYRTDARKSSGNYSLRNNPISDSQVTTQTYTFTIPADATYKYISFDYFVSSEGSFDWLTISLNGNQLVRVSGTSMTSFANFGTAQYLVNGTNTLTLQYSKDGSVSAGDDAGYIDNLTVSYAIQPSVSANENVNVAESLVNKNISLVKNESSTLTDALGLASVGKITSEMSTLTDTITTKLILFGFGHDVFGYDEFGNSSIKRNLGNDNLNLTDAISNKTSISANENIPFLWASMLGLIVPNDIAFLIVSKNSNEPVNLVDSIVSKSISSVLADIVNSTDSIIKSLQVSGFNDSYQFTDSLQLFTSIIKSENITSVTESLINLITKVTNDNIQLSDLYYFNTDINKNDVVNLADSIYQALQKYYNEAFNISDSIKQDYSKILQDTVNILEELRNTVIQTISELAINLSDSFIEYSFVKYLQLADTLILTESIFSFIEAVRNDSVNLLETIYKRLTTKKNDIATLLEVRDRLAFNSSMYVDMSIPNINTNAGEYVTVKFTMKWDGTNSVMPFGFTTYDLYFNGGNLGFNTGNGDLYGFNASNLVNKEVEVVAVFNNGDVTKNEIYIDGIKQNLSQVYSTHVSRNVTTNARIGGWTNNTNYLFSGEIRNVSIYNGKYTPEELKGYVSDLFRNLVAFYPLGLDYGIFHVGFRSVKGAKVLAYRVNTTNCPLYNYFVNNGANVTETTDLTTYTGDTVKGYDLVVADGFVWTLNSAIMNKLKEFTDAGVSCIATGNDTRTNVFVKTYSLSDPQVTHDIKVNTQLGISPKLKGLYTGIGHNDLIGGITELQNGAQPLYYRADTGNITGYIYESPISGAVLYFDQEGFPSMNELAIESINYALSKSLGNIQETATIRTLIGTSVETGTYTNLFPEDLKMAKTTDCYGYWNTPIQSTMDLGFQSIKVSPKDVPEPYRSYGTGGFISDGAPVSNGTTVIASCLFIGETGKSYTISFRGYDDGLGENISPKTFIATGGIQKIYTQPYTATKDLTHLRIQITTTINCESPFYVWDFQLEANNYARAFVLNSRSGNALLTLPIPNVNPATDTFTMSFDYMPNGYTEFNTVKRIFSLGNFAFYATINNPCGNPGVDTTRFDLIIGSDPTYNLNSPTEFVPYKTERITVTWASPVFKIYRNGILWQQITAQANPTEVFNFIRFRYSDAVISNVMFFNKELTQEEINRLVELSVEDFSHYTKLIAHYKLNSLEDAKDYGFNQYNGTVVNKNVRSGYSISFSRSFSDTINALDNVIQTYILVKNEIINLTDLLNNVAVQVNSNETISMLDNVIKDIVTGNKNEAVSVFEAYINNVIKSLDTESIAIQDWYIFNRFFDELVNILETTIGDIRLQRNDLLNLAEVLIALAQLNKNDNTSIQEFYNTYVNINSQEQVAIQEILSRQLDTRLSTENLLLTDYLINRYNLSKNEALNLAETLILNILPSINEQINIAEDVTKFLTAVLNDSTNVSENIIKNISSKIDDFINAVEEYRNSITKLNDETVNIQENTSSVSTYIRVFNEFANILENYIRGFFEEVPERTFGLARFNASSFGSVKQDTERMYFTDALSYLIFKSAILNDTMNLIESLIKNQTNNQPSESSTMSDTLGLLVGKIFNDNVNIADAFINQVNKVVNESINLVDSIINALSSIKEDLINLSDGILPLYIRQAFVDAVNLLDAVTTSPNIQNNELVNLTDLKVQATIQLVRDEISNLQDNIIKDIQQIQNLDNVALQDNMLRSVLAFLNDSLLLSETYLRKLDTFVKFRLFGKAYFSSSSFGTEPTESDSISFADSIQLSLLVGRLFTDTINLVDSIIASVNSRYNETITATEFNSININPNILDTLVLTDSIIRALEKTLLENITTVEQVLNSIAVYRGIDTANIVDSFLNLVTLNNNEQINLTDLFINYELQKFVNENAQLSEVLSKNFVFGTSFTENVTIQETTNLLYTIFNNENIQLTDSFIFMTLKNLADSITLNDALDKALGVNLTDTLIFVDALIRTLNNTYNESVVLIDNKEKIDVAVKNDDSIALAELQDRKVMIERPLAMFGDAKFGSSKFGTQQEVVSMQDIITSILIRAFNDNVNVSDSINSITSASRILNDNVNIQEIVNALVNLSAIVESININEIFSPLFNKGYNESMQLTDNYINSIAYVMQNPDVINLIDRLEKVDINQVINDYFNMTDFLKKDVVIRKSCVVFNLAQFGINAFGEISETFNATDLIVSLLSRTLQDSINTIEEVVKTPILTGNEPLSISDKMESLLALIKLSDAVNLQDTISMIMQFALNDLARVSDSIISDMQVFNNDNIVLTDAFIKSISNKIDDIVTITDLLEKVGLIVNDNVNIQEIINKSLGMNSQDGINLADSLSKLQNIIGSESIQASDLLNYFLSTTVTELALNLIDSISKSSNLIVYKGFGSATFGYSCFGTSVEVMKITDNLISSLTIVRYITDNMLLSDSLTAYNLAKYITLDTIQVVETMASDIGKAMNDSFTIQDSIRGLLNRYLYGSVFGTALFGTSRFGIEPTDILNMYDSINTQANYIRNVNDLITLIEILYKDVTNIPEQQNTTNMQDIVNLGIGKQLNSGIILLEDSKVNIQKVLNTGMNLIEQILKSLVTMLDTQPFNMSDIAYLQSIKTANELVNTVENTITLFIKEINETVALQEEINKAITASRNEALNILEILGVGSNIKLPDNLVGVIDETRLKTLLQKLENSQVTDAIPLMEKKVIVLNQVFINNVSVPVIGLTIKDTVTERVSTCTFTIPNPDQEIINLCKQRAEVRVYMFDNNQNLVYFGGRIKENPISAETALTTMLEITAHDYTDYAYDVTVSEVYTSNHGSISDIVRLMWQKYSPFSDLDLSGIETTDKQIPYIKFKYDSLFDATEKLAQLLGWAWYIDWDGSKKALRFFSPQNNIKNVTLSRENQNIIAGTAKFGKTSKIINRVYLFGGNTFSSDYTHTIIANGNDFVYTIPHTPYPPTGRNMIVVKVNGVEKVVDYDYPYWIEGKEVLVNTKGRFIRFKETNKPANGAVIEVIYRYEYPVALVLEDAESIRTYGLCEETITDNKITDVNNGIAYAKQILRDYANPNFYGSLETTEQGLRAGDYVRVYLPHMGVDGLFEIREVERRVEGIYVKTLLSLNKVENPENIIAKKLKDFEKRLKELELKDVDDNTLLQKINNVTEILSYKSAVKINRTVEPVESPKVTEGVFKQSSKRQAYTISTVENVYGYLAVNSSTFTKFGTDVFGTAKFIRKVI